MKTKSQCIEIEVVEPNEDIDFISRFEKNTGILKLGTIMEEEMNCRIDINDSVVLNITPQRYLASFEVRVPKTHWEKIDFFLPEIERKSGAIQFPENTINQKSFYYPHLKFLTNKQYQYLYIALFPDCLGSNLIILDSNCYAVAESNILTGFFIFFSL